MTKRSSQSLMAGIPLLAGYCLLTGGLIPFSAQAQNNAKTATVTGYLGDTTCSMKHSLRPGKRCTEGEDQGESSTCVTREMTSAAKRCTLLCVKQLGANYALVAEGDHKMYTLEGKQAGLDKLAGERVKVTGTVQGTTMKVTSVTSAKFEEAPDMD